MPDSKNKVKLAQLLLRRKELGMKVMQLQPINVKGLFETKISRKPVGDSYDDITSIIPVLSPAAVTREYDYYASQLRQVDALIQQANWTVEVEADSMLMKNYEEPTVATTK